MKKEYIIPTLRIATMKHCISFVMVSEPKANNTPSDPEWQDDETGEYNL